MDKKHAILLNPRYIFSGFSSQANNIKQFSPKNDRQLACLLSAVSKHIQKHGAECYASSVTLLLNYNQLASKFGTKPIKDRTLTHRLNDAEKAGLIRRQYSHDDHLGQTRRYISLDVDGIKRVFEGVYNYASKCAIALFNRLEAKKMRSGGSGVENRPNPNSGKGSGGSLETENCAQRTKDLSKESKKDKHTGIPSDSFYLKWFKSDADQVKSLQLSARKGLLSASGAKKLIALHGKWGYELGKGFKKYLQGVIWRSGQEGKQQPLKRASVEPVLELGPSDDDVRSGKAEYYRDAFGRIQVRWC